MYNLPINEKACLVLHQQQALKIDNLYKSSKTIIHKHNETSSDFFCKTLAKKPKIHIMTNELKTNSYQITNSIHKVVFNTPSSVSNIYNYNKLPLWRNLNKSDKLMCILRFAPANEFIAFTLRFSTKYIYNAYKSSKTLTNYISESIRNKYKYVFKCNPQWLFVVEFDKALTIKDNLHLFHIHGIINFSAQKIKTLKKIFKEVAFDKKHKQHPMNKNIIRFDNISSPSGWFEYLTKTQDEALTLLFISQNLIQRVKIFYSKCSKKHLNIVEQRSR